MGPPHPDTSAAAISPSLGFQDIQMSPTSFTASAPSTCLPLDLAMYDLDLPMDSDMMSWKPASTMEQLRRSGSLAQYSPGLSAAPFAPSFTASPRRHSLHGVSTTSTNPNSDPAGYAATALKRGGRTVSFHMGNPHDMFTSDAHASPGMVPLTAVGRLPSMHGSIANNMCDQAVHQSPSLQRPSQMIGVPLGLVSSPHSLCHTGSAPALFPQSSLSYAATGGAHKDDADDFSDMDEGPDEGMDRSAPQHGVMTASMPCTDDVQVRAAHHEHPDHHHRDHHDADMPGMLDISGMSPTLGPFSPSTFQHQHPALPSASAAAQPPHHTQQHHSHELKDHLDGWMGSMSQQLQQRQASDPAELLRVLSGGAMSRLGSTKCTQDSGASFSSVSQQEDSGNGYATDWDESYMSEDDPLHALMRMMGSMQYCTNCTSPMPGNYCRSCGHHAEDDAALLGGRLLQHARSSSQVCGPAMRTLRTTQLIC